jgi:hypothetical protein
MKKIIEILKVKSNNKILKILKYLINSSHQHQIINLNHL